MCVLVKRPLLGGGRRLHRLATRIAVHAIPTKVALESVSAWGSNRVEQRAELERELEFIVS